MRVLHVFGAMVRGGAELRTMDLMPYMARHGHQFDFCVLHPYEGEMEGRVRDLGGKIYRCPTKESPASFNRRFAKVLEQSRPDIVHSHTHLFTGVPLRVAAKRGVPGRIAHFRNTHDGKGNGLPRRAYRAAMRYFIKKHATAILAVSEGAMAYGYRANWQADPRASVLYNGIEMSCFEPSGGERASVLQEFGLPQKTRLVVMVARLAIAKAHDTALRMMNQLATLSPDVSLLIVGDGPLRDSIESQIQSLKLNSKVVVAGSRPDVPKLLMAADCALLTSRWEGLPGVVLEALAARTPVVATDLPGVREIASKMNGITIAPVDNVEALATGVFSVLEQNPVVGPMPDIFRADKVASKLASIYEKSVKPR